MISFRTKAMENIFKDNKEIFFFKSYKECLKKIIFYLKQDKLRNKISRRANIKVTRILKASHDDLVKKIIKQAFLKNEY